MRIGFCVTLHFLSAPVYADVPIRLQIDFCKWMIMGQIEVARSSDSHCLVCHYCKLGLFYSSGIRQAYLNFIQDITSQFKHGSEFADGEGIGTSWISKPPRKVTQNFG